MNFRILPVMGSLVVAFLLSAPILAAPAAQVGVGEAVNDDVVVDEVVVESSSTFTLTVRIDAVTTVLIPLQVDWLAQGPNPGTTDEMSITVSPRILAQGFFSVTLSAAETGTGSLQVSLATPVAETPPTLPVTTTVETTTTTTTTETVAPANASTANQIANLRNGPGTDFEIVSTAEVGAVLDVIGQNEDGTWLALAGGLWIAAFLVDNIPADLPVVSPAVAPPPLLPTPTPASPALIAPTNTPESAPLLAPTETPPAPEG